MDAVVLERKVNEYLAQNSGLDQKRAYLGISKIADCPRKVIDEFLNGVTVTEESHRMCFAGYEQERMVMQMLVAMNVARPYLHEVVAPFDSRLRGHVDGVTVDGDLLEIKSVSLRKFEQVTQTHQALRKHFVQVQLYMRYGGWNRAWVVYRSRETYQHAIVRVPYMPGTAEKYELKAKRLLAFIDSKVMPECECGHCKE